MYQRLHFCLWLCTVAAIFSSCNSFDGDAEKLSLIQERLQSAVDNDKERCRQSNWEEKYTEFHRNMLNSSSPKILVAIPHPSGLADRIIGLTSSFMLAILTDRAFQIGRRGELPLLETVFNSPHINWTRAADPDWLIAPLKEKANPTNYAADVLSTKEYFAVNTINNWPMHDAFLRKDIVPILGGADTKTTLIVSNRGKTIRLFENTNYAQRLADMKLTPFTAFGCLVNYLMQPKREIFLPVYDQFRKMSTPEPSVLKISIQIRAGDHIWGSNGKELSASDTEGMVNSMSRFFSCAEQIEQFVLEDNPGKYSSVLWYLATDSVALRHGAVAKYGANKIVTQVRSHIEHSAKEASVCHTAGGGGGAASDCASGVSDLGFSTAAAEWWLLGYADYHVITLNSGYGRSGGFRTLSEDKHIYTVHDKPTDCGRKGYRDMENIMYDWSSI